jgi:hypothetical protein
MQEALFLGISAKGQKPVGKGMTLLQAILTAYVLPKTAEKAVLGAKTTKAFLHLVDRDYGAVDKILDGYDISFDELPPFPDLAVHPVYPKIRKAVERDIRRSGQDGRLMFFYARFLHNMDDPDTPVWYERALKAMPSHAEEISVCFGSWLSRKKGMSGSPSGPRSPS